jgi:hypothetical protein
MIFFLLFDLFLGNKAEREEDDDRLQHSAAAGTRQAGKPEF